MSILRFIRGNKSKRLEISASGLSLKYHKASTSKVDKNQTNPDGEELVLTNMAFYTGLHLWEIIAPISCNSMQFGVYNPVTKTEILTSFKTTTPRTVTVCLDLNENMVKFWLNDRRNAGKNLKLTEGGPWYPCVKISTERNKLILNPYAREPSDFYEKDFDKRFTLRKFLMPHLFNMVCITNLQQQSSRAKASQLLKDRFKIQSSDIRTILMPNLPTLEQPDNQNPSKDSFCFLQFNFIDSMAEFIQKNKSTDGVVIYQPYQIAEWFEKSNDDLPSTVKEAFKTISSHILVPKADQLDALNAISAAYTKLITNKDFLSPNQVVNGQNNLSISIVPHTFSDKILLKNDNFLAIVSKDNNSNVFNLASANLNEPPITMTSYMSLKIEVKLLHTLFSKINWSSLFKENNLMINSFIQQFFESMAETAQVFREGMITFRAKLDSTKFFIDLCIQHMRSQLDRLKRHYQNCQTVVNQTNPLQSVRIKPEVPIEILVAANLPFYEDPNFSVDDIYLALHVLYDLQEQIWAQAKSRICNLDVKSFVDTVSRPFSAFNRLGSFITWGSTRGDSQASKLADQGFFLRENMSVSQFENPAIEIQDVCYSSLQDQSFLREQLGSSNRMLNSLVCENVPLHKTLSYFSPTQCFLSSKIVDVIPSPNSDFFLIGGPNGVASIAISSPIFPSCKMVSFFETDKQSKLKKHNKLMDKVFQRILAIDDYKKQMLRKGTAISILNTSATNTSSTTEVSKRKGSDIIEKHKKKALTKKKIMASQFKGAKLKEKKIKTKPKHDQSEEVEGTSTGLMELFGDFPAEDQKGEWIAKKHPTLLKSQNVNDCKVLGYILLSKPSSMNVIDPLLVGCVFYNSKLQKYYLRVKKLTFAIQYIQIFITLDPITGHAFNKISGKQLLNLQDIGAMNEEILNHKETIIDLYTVYMRTQVVKNDWPKKDCQFQIFDDLSEADIEIEDCKRVIDFTRCSYAVDASNQKIIHMVIENTQSQIQLIQYNIKDNIKEFNEGSQIMPIELDKGKEMHLDPTPLRVFQFDNQILVVNRDSYQVLLQDSFKIISDAKLLMPIANEQSVTIINMTESGNLFNQANLQKFSDASSSIPQQDWHLVINERTQDSPFTKYKIFTSSEIIPTERVKTEKIVESQINLSEAAPSDIIQIGSLLESKCEGSIPQQNQYSLLRSNGIDSDNGLQLLHHWQLLPGAIKPADFTTFQAKLPDKEIHLKQIDLEFNFRRMTTQHITFESLSEQQEQGVVLYDDSIGPQRLPLVVETFTGAQINDYMHPNLLTSPDSYVFCSNYPQPEFIFKLQSNKMFVPTTFIVKSKENRIFNGVPINQGLIFASDSLEDLMNTKQFSKLTEKELNKWCQERFGQLKGLPLLPSEPIAYFNMEEKTEISIEVPAHIKKPVKYIKFIPTGFRKSPINFSSKPFHSNQVECQFFGVNGYELQALRKTVDESPFEAISQKLKQKIELNLSCEISESSKGFTIGQIDNVCITEIRSAKPSQCAVPVTSLSQLTIPNVIGVGRVQLAIKEEHSSNISSIIVKLPTQLKSSEWELTGVSILVKSYTDSSASFTSSSLRDNKPKLRHYLLDISHFSSLLGKLLETAQNDQVSDDMRVASLQCILNFLKNNRQDKNYSEFLKLFRDNTEYRKILCDTFIDRSVKFQQTAQAYLEKIGFPKSNSEFSVDVFIMSQVDKLFDEARPIQKVKQVFDLLSLCSPAKRNEIQTTLLDLLLNKICQVELPKLQTQDYILLRSQHGINLFPYDDISFKANEDSAISQSFKSECSSNLSCKFEMYKLNTYYQYNVDFGNISEVSNLKLFFEADDKSNYKIMIRVFAPNATSGSEEILLRKAFDENYYFQVCERAFKPEIIEYFNNAPSIDDADKQAAQNIQDSQLQQQLNCIPIEFPGGYVGRYLRIQVELQDTFKSVHKNQQPYTQNFIRPEFQGHIVDEIPSKEIENFKIKGDHQQKQLLSKLDFYGGAVTYQIYNMPDEPLSQGNKACLIVVNEKSQQPKLNKEDSEVGTVEEVAAITVVTESNNSSIEESRECLKKQVRSGKLSKRKIKKKAIEVMKKTVQIKDSPNQLSLRYLLSLSNVIASLTTDLFKQQSLPSNIENINSSYSLLFKRFTVYDIREQNLNIIKLLVAMSTHMTDKTQFVSNIIKEYLLVKSGSVVFSLKNVLSFINQQKDIDVNQLINIFTESFNIKSISKKLENHAQVNELIIKTQKIVSEDDIESIEVQQYIALLTICDDLSQQKGQSQLQVEPFLKLLMELILKCPQIKDSTNENGFVAYKYTLYTLLNCIQLSVSENLLDNCQQQIASLIIMGMQRNDKDVDGKIKSLVIALAKNDKSNSMTPFINSLLTWYQEKSNITATPYYMKLDSEKQGKGAGIFYKHMSQIFEYYMDLLQNQSLRATCSFLIEDNKESSANDTVEKVYKDLGKIVQDLLEVLVSEQNSENYEHNFYEVWMQVFKTMVYLTQHSLVGQSIVDNFVSKFYLLKPILRECLYPELHNVIQSSIFKRDSYQMLISLLKAFFKVSNQDVKLTYCFIDGLLKIFQTGKKDGTIIPAVYCMFKEPKQVGDLTQIFSEYINMYINQGVFTGCTAGSVDLVIKLDIAVQMSTILLNAQGALEEQNAFEDFIKADLLVELKQKVFSELIQWMILNSTTSKKGSPVGSRIHTLSTNVEQLLGKISVSEQTVSICLPILMKSILQADFKLRELIHKSEGQNNLINFERGISIQKTVNSLFLSFFKQWVQTDTVAKKFLTELNGFDFLLDRLFSKAETHNAEQMILQPTASSIIEHALLEDLFKEGVDQGNDLDDDDELSDNEDQIMSIALQKLVMFKEPSILSKIEKKAISIKNEKLAKSKTTVVAVPEKKVETDVCKEVEQTLSLDDWAKNIKLIWSSDKEGNVKQMHAATQWFKFKNGQKNRPYNCQLTDPAHQYEYVMKFELESDIILNEVQIGVVYNWSTYDLDSNYEPITLILEGGKEENTVDWRLLLQPCEDDGFKMNCMTMYAHNFTDSSTPHQSSLESVIQNIGCKEARFLTFRFRKPIMACTDQSLFVAQVSKIKSYGISFVSVMGTKVPKAKEVFSYLIDIQKENSLEVLSKFFSSEFTQAFEMISEQETIIDKIKNAFDKLSILMNTKASLIKPIFLAICAKNETLGDWIMDNRLVSMDPSSIKKEQITFLGDIISSNREKQLFKVMKLKYFIIAQINAVALGKLVLSVDQLSLLRRYLKLFNNKLREYALQWKSSSESTQLQFLPQDLDNVVALMSECTDSTKARLFNSLTEFALILLIPPRPLQNQTISVDEYIEKVLIGESKNQLQSLLFCSIMASTNEHAIHNILKLGKIEWVLHQFKQEQDMFQYAQILFNCSKQAVFRDKFRNTIPFDLYNFLKVETDTKTMRQGLPELTVNLIVYTIRDLILGGEAELEQFSNILKEDIIKSSDKGDVEFINKVIVPLLHAEEKIPITISQVDESSKALFPIYQGTESSMTAVKDNFFLNTTILNKKQKGAFGKMFKELTQTTVDNYQQLQSSSWELIFEDKAHQNQNPAKFRQFVKATNNRSNVIILVHCKVQDQQVVFGGFTNKNFPSLGETWAHEFDYQIPFSEANFVCYYTPEKELHFNMTHNKAFGYIYTDYEEGGALSISGDFFLISWSYEFQNSCGNIYDMKCIEDQSTVSFYNNMEISHIEVWSCDVGKKSTMTNCKIKGDLKKHPMYKSISPFNFFRENLVFEVSKNMTLSRLSKEILGNASVFINFDTNEPLDGSLTVEHMLQLNQALKHGDSILDLVIRQAAPVITAEQPGLLIVEPEKVVAVVEPALTHNQPLLKKFEDKGGIFDLIKASKAAVKLYKSDKLRDIWSLWLNEIESFSQLPSFFSTFCQDRDKEVIIYNLIEGVYDYSKADVTSPDCISFIAFQEELHIEMVKYSYKIVSQVFENHEGAELRNDCLKNGTFERFVERIGQLSSEKKRVKVEIIAEVAPPIVGQSHDKKEDKKEQMKKKKKKDGEKKDLKRKGVGYTTGNGTAWNVTEYLKSKEAKSSQAANIVNILKNMIKSKDWEAPPEIKEVLLESALLPTLEAALRSGSLLEMAKEYELNIAYLQFIQELATHSNLIDLLLDIGEEYEPRQKEPIHNLLSKLGDLSQIFLGCLSEESKLDEVQAQPKNLAEMIRDTNNIVKEKINQQTHTKQLQSLADTMALPLSEAYWKLLSPQRFDYMSMKSTSGIYNHVYSAEMAKNVSPPVGKLVRLAQEIADLSNSLPCDYTNAVFCRVDKERVDVMKCIIMGASGTPYAHGAFVFDLFFENSYPNSPPKCQLVTTGGQTVRFNPNLYNNGKVCLSLLGTWRGQSTENWDAKISTILQVLLSLQAIIMSNEVYFNEPGYEHEAGTVDGERKNDGYANIVRYCNVKFAIIDQIKNPTPGFEKIIRSSFYLKKNEVLKEVREWVDKAKTSDALYTGLVYDHNYHWAPQISPDGKYSEMMEAIYKELKETLDSLPSPFEDKGLVIERQFSKYEDELNEENKDSKKVPTSQTITKIEDIDVSYEPANEMTEGSMININDDKVKDRWSRYIGAMGIEAVAKQAESRILISGLGPLGVEIAKNIVLAGCKELILFDDVNPMADEVSGQFFITMEDVQKCDYAKTRAHYSRDKLQQLNFYVKVTVLDSTVVLADYIASQDDLKVVILTDFFQFTIDRYNQIRDHCKIKKIAMINAYQNGLFGKVFNDFGAEFIIQDKDGEELQEVMIKDISYSDIKETTIVTLLPGFKHRYEDGDQIQFREVLGMQTIDDQMGASINDKVVTIKVINPTQFSIDEDSRKYTLYSGNGIAKQVKVPKKLSFLSLEECYQEEKEGKNPRIDLNLLISDFEKIENKQFLHYIYKCMSSIISKEDYFDDDQFSLCKTFLEIVTQEIPQDLIKEEKSLNKLKNLTYMFCLTQRYTFPPIAAFLGGVVTQEIVKAITQKYTPIHQHFYFDCSELYPEQDIFSLDEEEKAELIAHQATSDRYQGLKACLGSELFENIRDCRVFMIGAGAIGCELMKNYAMLGLGTGKEGMIVVTDPDVIEVSNLNRQFLFREKHLRKPKSQTAAAAAIQMNPQLKHHISARLDKIHADTGHIYSESFFQDQTIITNALDNIQARLFIDQKCVASRVPLIDSGTLGPKGHVQVVLPELKTESYASQRDPDDNTGEIPHCTLKMFPEETLHCVEWAKDLFGNLFTLQPQSFNKLVIEQNPPNFFDQQEKMAVKKALKLWTKKPQSFEDCIRMARMRFQKHFANDVLQLLHVYPIDKLTKEGRPFWSLPKRPPMKQEFNPENQMHANVLAAFACLYAKLYGIKIPYLAPRSKESKYEMAKQASAIIVPEFVANDQKALEIESQVDKEQSAKDQDTNQEDSQTMIQMPTMVSEIDTLMVMYNTIIIPLRDDKMSQLTVEEFEKDNDQNFHIDFIHALANVRAANYKLDEMDWITVKIKAGKIVPALATTTAAIAALQTIELIKYLKDSKIEEHRNSFLNLAVPSLMMSEPATAMKTKLGTGEDMIEVTLWDRWEFEVEFRDVTLLNVVEYLEKTYKLTVRDIFFGSIPLFMHALHLGGDRNSALKKIPLVTQTNSNDETEFIDLTVTFIDQKATGENSEKVLEGVPQVRVILPAFVKK